MQVLPGARRLLPSIVALVCSGCSGDAAVSAKAFIVSDELVSLEKLVRANPSTLRVRTPEGSLIHYGAAHGTPSCVKLLIDLGANANERGSNGAAPVHFAVKEKRSQTLQALIDRGADVSASDDDGFRAIHLAASVGSAECLKRLLAAGALPDSIAGMKQTPLHLAASKDADGIARLLLKSGAAVDPRDENNETPLDYAVRWRCPRVVELLRKHGAPLNLFSAAAVGDINQLHLLLKAHPNAVNAKTLGAGETALHVAARWEMYESVTALALEQA